MAKRRSVGRGVGRKTIQNNRFNIETLEDRRLLSSVTYGTPISTALPTGFVPQGVQPVTGVFSNALQSSLLVTGAGGGAIVVSPNGDGTFATLGTVSSSDMVLGAASAENSQGSPELVVFTTTGYMIQQQNGSFSAPAGYTLPTDVVPGATTIGLGFPATSSTGPALIVEQFVPNSGDPTLGSIILSTYYQNTTNGTFGQHKDTTIATNVASPAGEAFLSSDLNGDGISDVVANGSIWFGNADGSFRIGPSLGLSTAEQAATLTAGPLFVNGASNNDLVLYPAPATIADPNSDAAEVFVNNGAGTFTRGPRVDLAAAGTTTGPVLVTDLNDDGVPDIGVVVSSGASAPALAVAQGTTNNGFIGTVLQPLPANVQIVGTSTGAPAGLNGIEAKIIGGTTKYSLDAIPETAIPGPIITLSLSSTSVFVGQRVVITVDRSFNDAAGTSYTLLDGTNTIGTTAVAADGSVTFAVSSLAAGAHVLTAVSANSPGDVSAPLTLTVNADPPTGLVFATGLQPQLRAVEVPGDTPTIKVSLRNIGGATATSPLAVTLFASTTTDLTSAAVPIPDTQLSSLNPNLGVKKDRTISSKMMIPDNLTPGTYFLIAKFAAAKQSGTNQVIGGTIVDFSSFQVAWQFGHVGTRSNVKFVQHLSSGNVVTFALTGNGYGVVTPGTGPLTLGNNNPNFEVNIAQTNIKSRLTISQTGGTKSNILGLTFNSDVGTVDVHTDTPHLIGPGPLDVNGNPLGTDIYSIKELSIGTVPAAQLTSTAPLNTSTVADINVNGFLGELNTGTIDDATVEVGADASAATELNIGTLGQSASISSSVPISKLNFGTAQPGSSIVAPSIGALKTTGNFSASLTLSGATHGAVILGSVDIGGSVSGGLTGDSQWAVNGNIGDILIRGNVAKLQLLAGAKLGPMGQLTTPLAAFSGVSIKSLTIDGSVTSSLLSAGLDPVDGVFLNGNDQLLPGGSFGSISIGSTVDTNTKIVASSLPATATIGRQKVQTAVDPRFLLISNP